MDDWYEAEIIDCNQEKGLVLIHYKGWDKKYDEWINQDSYRLAPLHATSKKKKAEKSDVKTTAECLPEISQMNLLGSLEPIFIPNVPYDRRRYHSRESPASSLATIGILIQHAQAEENIISAFTIGDTINNQQSQQFKNAKEQSIEYNQKKSKPRSEFQKSHKIRNKYHFKTNCTQRRW